MARKRTHQEQPILAGLEITDMADKGRGLARHEGKVIFVAGAVPGDVATVRLQKEKASFAEGMALEITRMSSDRVVPFCPHFGTCGGCKWQHLSYEAQLRHKQGHVEAALSRIGHVALPPVKPILASPRQTFYRNKLEFTATPARWLDSADLAAERAGQTLERRGLGFHVPGRFDKVVDIRVCFHQPDPSNQIRDAVRAAALRLDVPFWDMRTMADGWLRNLILRSAESTGQWMVILQVGYEQADWLRAIFDEVIPQFPQVTTWLYVINGKGNETFHDLEVHTWAGPGYIEEQMEDLRFRIGPKSFFQTNAFQALELYKITRGMARLTGAERLYDLYTGTGTIGLFLAGQARQVVGVEYVEQAVEDARRNAELNGVAHAHFFAGDMARILTPEFIAMQGRPDVVITDPPRAGMDEAVTEALLAAAPARIVYVSCNPATQARDLERLDAAYVVEEVQPVDMFPHTDHVENVVRLERRS